MYGVVAAYGCTEFMKLLPTVDIAESRSYAQSPAWTTKSKPPAAASLTRVARLSSLPYPKSA